MIESLGGRDQFEFAHFEQRFAIAELFQIAAGTMM